MKNLEFNCNECGNERFELFLVKEEIAQCPECDSTNLQRVLSTGGYYWNCPSGDSTVKPKFTTGKR